MKIPRWLSIYTFVSLVAFSQVGATSTDDALVERALRASLLQKPDGVRLAARQQRQAEVDARKQGGKPERIAENIESLAIATSRPVPVLKEAKRALSDYGSDPMTKNLDRLLRRMEPRQQFLEARADRRYDDARRAVNGVVVPIINALQGQFFALIALPFEAVEYAVVGRRFPTPEQRRELDLGRRAIARFDVSVLEGDPEAAREKLTPRRRKLAALQARQNAEKAFRVGQQLAASFWFEQEMQLENQDRPIRKKHFELLAEQSRQEALHRDGLSVIVDGDSIFAGTSELSLYRALLRSFLLDPTSEETVANVRKFYVDHPGSAVLGVVLAVEAASSRTAGEIPLAREHLLDLEARELPGSWKLRATEILGLSIYTPEEEFIQAQAVIDDRWNQYIYRGDDPKLVERRSFYPEEARIRRGTWISKARGLFVTDSLARLLFLPFLDPFPRTELMDAEARVPEDWLRTPEGMAWLEKVAKAQRIAGRYLDAAQTWQQLGKESRAQGTLQAGARHLERTAKRTDNPREAALLLRRLLAVYPEYRRAERAEKMLADSSVKAEAQVIVPVDELKAWPELMAPNALGIDPQLVDGRKDNGEIDKSGLVVMRWAALKYKDRSTGNWIEIPFEPEQRDAFLRLYEPRKRTNQLNDELAKPLPRKRIPLAVDIGAVPGFDVSPGLVPLDPDPANQELYR